MTGDNQLTESSSACSPLPRENKKHLSIPVSYLSSTRSHFLCFPSPRHSLHANRWNSKAPVKSDIALGSGTENEKYKMLFKSSQVALPCPGLPPHEPFQAPAFEPSQELFCLISLALSERQERFPFIFEHGAVLQGPVVKTQEAGLSLKPVYSLCCTECITIGLEIAAVVISTFLWLNITRTRQFPIIYLI